MKDPLPVQKQAAKVVVASEFQWLRCRPSPSSWVAPSMPPAGAFFDLLRLTSFPATAAAGGSLPDAFVSGASLPETRASPNDSFFDGVTLPSDRIQSMSSNKASNAAFSTSRSRMAWSSKAAETSGTVGCKGTAESCNPGCPSVEEVPRSCCSVSVPEMGAEP